MLYFFYGTDTDKARARAKAVIEVMKGKRPDAEYFRVTADNFDQALFESFAESQGLFERKFIVFVDGVFDRPEAKEFIVENCLALAESENAFVILERAVDAASVKKIEKSARETKKFEKV